MSFSILIRFRPGHSEKNLDDVLQISAVFVNVSKGEQAKAADLKKAFGKMSEDKIIEEVRTTRVVYCSSC